MFSLKIMTITLVCIGVLLVGIACYFYFVQTKNMKNEIRFTGVITAVDFQGKIDGSDYITVNGMQIKLAGGKSENDSVWGKIIGIDLSKQGSEYIGKTVNVYATKYIPKVTADNHFSDEMEDSRLTLQGNKNYFVLVMP